MDKTTNLAAKRLLKRLSALRATLRKDERLLLNDWLSREWYEVTAHTMNLGKATHMTLSNATSKTTEVAGHKMDLSKATEIATYHIMYDTDKGQYLLLEA